MYLRFPHQICWIHLQSKNKDWGLFDCPQITIFQPPTGEQAETGQSCSHPHSWVVSCGNGAAREDGGYLTPWYEIQTHLRNMSALRNSSEVLPCVVIHR